MASPNDLTDIINVQTTISSGGGTSIQAFGDPIFISTFAANVSFPGRLKAYTGTLSQMRAALVADGFATTSAPYRQVTAAMTQGGPPNKLYIGRADAADADWNESLTAIWAAASLADQSLYFFAVDTRDPSEIEEIADWAQTEFACYMGQTNSSAVYNNTPGNVALNILAKGYDRTALLWHDPAVASNYGPATLISRTGPFVLPSTSGTLEFRIDGGALQTFTILASAATVLGSQTGPFAVADGDEFEVAVDGGDTQTLEVELAAATILSGSAQTYDITPAWTLRVRVDGGAQQTVTFSGTKGELATTTGAPWNLTDGWTITFAIDGGANQVVTFNTADFVSIAAATAEEVAVVFTAALSGADVDHDGLDVTVTSSRFGSSSNVEIVAGDAGALAALGYIVGDNLGTGFAVFLDAATAAEVAAEINADTTGLTAAAESGSVRITSDLEGKASRIQVVGGLANGALNFNTNEVSGSGDFADGSAVTTSDMVEWLSANLYGLNIVADTNAVRFTTRTRGNQSSINVTASTLATTLGFSVTTTMGSGDVANAAEASAAEIAAKIASTLTDGVASDASSAIVIASDTDGPTSTVQLVGGTYRTLLFGVFSATGTGTDEDYADCAWLGRCSTFPLDQPNGQSTWDNHNLVGILPDAIPSATRTVLHETLKVNTYERRNGRSETHFGTVLYGENSTTFRFIDQRVTADWGDARMTEAFKSVLNRLANQKTKSGYSTGGFELFASEFRRIGRRGETNGHWIYDDSSIDGPDDTGITIPMVAGQTQPNINIRRVAGFVGQWRFQDAIHRVDALLNLSINLEQ
jgi:hypothetical protein